MEATAFARPTSNLQQNLENDRGSSSWSSDQQERRKRTKRNSRSKSGSRDGEQGNAAKKARNSGRVEEEEAIKTPILPVSGDLIHSNSCSTTFVQADVASFRDLVQRLTGARDDSTKMPVTKAAGQGRPVLGSSSKRSSTPASRFQQGNSPSVIKSLPTRRNLFLKNAMVLDLVSPKSPLSLALNSSPSSSSSASSCSSSSHHQLRMDHGLFLQLESLRRPSSSHHSSGLELLPLFPMN